MGNPPIWKTRWPVAVSTLVVLASTYAIGCTALGDAVSRGDGGGGGTSSQYGVGGGGEEPTPGTTNVGAACDFDIDCGDHDDSLCVTSQANEPIFTGFWGADETGAGVAGGYCSRPCDADTPCPDGSRCGGGICLRQCEFGSPELAELTDALDTNKCLGRDDLMCVPTSGGDAVCMPNCGAGSDCDGRTCDTRVGVCTDPERFGFDNGHTCEPDNEATTEDEDECSGLCFPLLDADSNVMAAVCSSRCSLGGSGQDCGGPSQGVCAHPRISEDGDVGQLGDQGYCASACTFHDQCGSTSGIFCFDLGAYATEAVGYCLPAPSCENGAICEDDQVCTETGAGMVCLDRSDDGTTLLFPFTK